MVKKAYGFVREIPSGDPINAVPVTIRDRLGNAVTGGTANPTTSAADGSWSWSIDLSPGPIYAEAVVSGTETKRRHGKETFQVDTVWNNDILEIGKAFSNGPVYNYLNAFNTTIGGGTRELSVNTGRAFLSGYVIGIDTAVTRTGSANTTLANRWDLIILRQYISGNDIGKQLLLLVEGTVDATDPTINNVADTVDIALFRGILPNGAGAYSSVVDRRSYSTPTAAQPLDATLTAIAALVGAADRLPYFTGVDALSLATFTAAGRALVDDATAADQLTTLGAVAKAGDTMTGALRITSDSNVALRATRATGGLDAFNVNSTGTPRVELPNGTDLIIYSGDYATQRWAVDGATGDNTIGGAINHDGATAGFFGTAPGGKPTVSGSRGGNAALASLLTALAGLGLVVDGSSA